MIERKEYLEELKKWKDKDLIKVITGIRRCGKSTLFELFIDYLKQIGVKEDHIISINLESPEYTFADYMELYNYVNDKINLSLDGPDKIRNNLKKLKVDNDIIDKALSNIDENIVLEHIKKLINKKINSTKYTGYVLKNKITIYLINLGYSKYLINKVLDNMELNNNLDGEMEKIYKKLSLKYQDDELKLKLKQKLYSKGFSAEKINEFINNRL